MSGGGNPIEIEVLGTTRLRVHGRFIDVGRPRRRAVLGFLAARAGTTVSQDELVDAVWGERPPGSAVGNLHSYISELRRSFEPVQALATTGKGYRLEVPDGAVDALRLAERTDAAARLTHDGRVADALVAWREALAAWRGTPFADIDAPFADAERERLGNVRLLAIEGYAETLLREGHGESAVALLAKAVAEQPLHERLAELFLHALHSTGRREQALRHFAATTAQLADELGLDPSPRLTRMHERVSTDDPSLLPARTPAFTGREDELDRLDARFEHALRAPAEGQVLVHAVDGPAGSGKTALALEFAHRVARRFPDGCLYLDLRGSRPDVLATSDALARLLAALGVDPPAQDSAGGAASYRSHLAGRRVLLVLDDAERASQVRPLLPGSGGSAVLVTSREPLTGLVARDGAHRLALTARDGQHG